METPELPFRSSGVAVDKISCIPRRGHLELLGRNLRAALFPGPLRLAGAWGGAGVTSVLTSSPFSPPYLVHLCTAG